MAMSRDEIFTKVQEVLIDALGVDDDEVTTEATLMGDLGAGHRFSFRKGVRNQDTS